ncbi:unnamed protein product [Pleuronectes platessa]|uniref:Uncharacterized protein n=1 Tax=Pleuronectes platessa TaxID=8262 RepID=A0A9N7USW8_PLEPL|nr:unnamed protein product [Pleuronectes platessa]
MAWGMKLSLSLVVRDRMLRYPSARRQQAKLFMSGVVIDDQRERRVDWVEHETMWLRNANKRWRGMCWTRREATRVTFPRRVKEGGGVVVERERGAALALEEKALGVWPYIPRREGGVGAAGESHDSDPSDAINADSCEPSINTLVCIELLLQWAVDGGQRAWQQMKGRPSEEPYSVIQEASVLLAAAASC